MRKRLVDCFLFLILLIGLCAVIDAFSFTAVGDYVLGKVCFSTGYRHIGSSEIIPAIEKVQEKDSYTKLVIGDSVCHQIFNSFQEVNDEYLLCGTNQAITVDGQYILARLFLESHSEATDIYLVMLPGGFPMGCESIQSYSYLVEPFGEAGKLDYLSRESLDKMRQVYGRLFMNSNVIKILDGSSINNKIFLYYNQKRLKQRGGKQGTIVSEEARYYLCDLYDRCKERDVKLHVIPPAIVDSPGNRQSVSDLNEYIEGSELEQIMKEYFTVDTYFPSEMFLDGTHFGGEYACIEIYKKYIDIVMQGNLLENFKVE